MKRHAILLLLILLTVLRTFAQTPQNLLGTWEGTYFEFNGKDTLRADCIITLDRVNNNYVYGTVKYSKYLDNQTQKSSNIKVYYGYIREYDQFIYDANTQLKNSTKKSKGHIGYLISSDENGNRIMKGTFFPQKEDDDCNTISTYLKYKLNGNSSLSSANGNEINNHSLGRELISTTPRPVLNNNLPPPTNDTTIKKYGDEKQSTSTALPNANEKAATDKGLSPVAAQLFKTVRLYTEGKGFGAVINLNLSNDDKNTIADLSGLKLNENDTLFWEETYQRERPFQAYLEAYDYNADGVYELILRKDNRMGPKMRSEFTIYNKSVLKYANLNIPQYRLVLKGYGTPAIIDNKTLGFYNLTILEINGDDAPLYVWDGSKYRESTIAPTEEEPAKKITGLVGGATPDELGKNLLKALQTNNKQLWLSCLHPTDFRSRERCENSFKQYRDGFTELGLTQWNLVKFSRVTFTRVKPEEDVDHSGEKKCHYFTIEFTYKNSEFLGVSSYMKIQTYKNENYFVYGVSPAGGIRLMRYKKNQ